MEVLRRRSIRWGDTWKSETQLLCQVVGETPVNLNVEALKQAARRYTRKFKERKKGGKGDLEGCCSKSPRFQPLIVAEGDYQESQHLCFEEEQVEDVEEIKVEPSEGF